MDNINFLKDILSESELRQLEQLEKKIYDKVQETIGNIPQQAIPDRPDFSSPYAFDEINQPNHCSNSDRELIFYVRAEISTIDKHSNRYLSLDKCVDESFHIPIPSGIDLKNKISDFMSILEQDLGHLAKKIDKLTNG